VPGEEETEKGEVVGAARHTLQGMGQLPSYKMPYAPPPFFSDIWAEPAEFWKNGIFCRILGGKSILHKHMYECRDVPVHILYVIIYTGWVECRRDYTVKKRFASFPSPAGMSLPNSPWAGIMTS
jgi:hypothetical protein